MIYKEVKPHYTLANYIDAFWTATNDRREVLRETILPDGCVDVILNPGPDCKTDNGTFNIKSETVCLVGTITQFKLTEMNPENQIVWYSFQTRCLFSFPQVQFAS